MADVTQFMPNATIHLHRHDLPDGLELGPVIAVDTETMGLDPRRDRLCLVQISSGDGQAHLVQLIPPALGGRGYDCPNLKAQLSDPNRVKLMHFARFDVAMLYHALGIRAAPVKCTKIAAKLVRTFTDRHGLRDLCRELLGVEISKQQQTSDWGAPELTSEQLAYAASDVHAPPPPMGAARGAADPRKSAGSGGGMLRLPAGALRARSPRLRGTRHLRPSRLRSRRPASFAQRDAPAPC